MIHLWNFYIKNASAFLPRRAGCEAPSSLRGCDPPEAFISVGKTSRFCKRGIDQYPARLSGGLQSPTEINAPRGCAGIRFGRCQLALTRIPRQFSRARIEFENRFANLIIIIRAISSPFYRQLLAELPIKSILHREIILTMKASFTLHTYLMSEDTSIAR